MEAGVANFNGPYLPLSDWWDGMIYREYLAEKGILHPRTGADIRDMALSIGLDGVPLGERGDAHPRSVTPVIIKVLNLPPHVRQNRRQTILCCVLPGPGEPSDLTTWLYPIWKDLELLGEGIVALDASSRVGLEPDEHVPPAEAEVARHVVRATPAQYFTLKAYLVLAIGDQKAIRTLSKLRGHGSRYGCRLCRIEGVHVQGSTLYYYPHLQENRGPEAEPFDAAHPPMRTNMAARMRRACAVGNEADLEYEGISGRTVSPLINLPGGSLHFTRGVP